MDRSGLKRKLAVLAALTCLALVAAACSNGNDSGGSSSSASAGGSGASSAPADLKVELDWTPNPDHVGLYYAQDKGYFADENLTVSFQAPATAADPIKLVGLNKVDLAIFYESGMFYGQESGLPVMSVATVVPVPLNSLIVSPDVPMSDLSQISGKSVGVTGLPSDDDIYNSMLTTAGVSASDVTKVNVGFNLVQSLLSNKVDAIIGGYQNVEAIQVEQETGKKPTVYPANELGVPNYAELIVAANADKLSSDPAYADAVTRFVAALIKGTDGAIADPAGATAVMKDVTQYDAKFLDESVPYTLTLLKPAAGTKTGCIDSAAWQSYGDWMKTNGLIKSTPDAAAISTDRYMPYSCS